MQNAETILRVIQDKGKRGLPLERVYRLLYNPALYQQAYAHIYANQGALTPGATENTLDRMSNRRIEQIIETVRQERWHWTPVRRVAIPKNKPGEMRPLGLPTGDDKLLQATLKLILEAYYEPQFSDHSHGFRPGRGVHTALEEIIYNHSGTKWFIEGDIAKCFDSLDHEVLLSILSERIHDQRVLRLIRNLLKAGYWADWQWHATLSGAPQGGILSPLLTNIYLDKLDKFVEATLIPAYTQGLLRGHNPEYDHYRYQREQALKRNDPQAAKDCLTRMRSIPSQDVADPHYRRLKYIRYADDFLLSFVGPRREAEEIKSELTDFLWHELKLNLSQAKTLITQASRQPAHFLGHEVTVQYSDTKITPNGRRGVNGKIALRIPYQVIQKLAARYKRNGKPIHRAELLLNSDYDIMVRYQSEYRGYVQFYALTHNLNALGELRWIMETSLLKTLANKFRSKVSKMTKKYRTVITTPYGQMKGLGVTIERQGKAPLRAEFGGIPLRRQKRVSHITDGVVYLGTRRSELLQRMNANQCELCGSAEDIQVHHIRKLADLNIKGRRAKPIWMKRMAELRRKTLVVCQACHTAIHNGEHRAVWTVSEG